MPESDLYNKFQQDKSATLALAEEFLNENKSSQINAKDLKKYRDDVEELVQKEKFTEAMQTLEKLRDVKSGIILHEKEKDGVQVVIRDARKAKQPAARSSEAFEMQYLNAVRAAVDIIKVDIIAVDDDDIAIKNKVDLEKNLQEKVKKFIGNFPKGDEISQKDYSLSLKEHISEIGELLEKHGIEDAYKKIDTAKDFQNFNDEHKNIITISSVKHKEENHTVIEAEVAMKGMTKLQKRHYQNIAHDSDENNIYQKPSWYNAMPLWEQKLCKKYSPIIEKGQHVIPTQLRQIAGMKNTFEKNTAIFKNNKLEVIHNSKHAGTLASFAKSKKARQEITDENARQAQEWVGENAKLHCNSFNSGPLGAGKDPEIVKRTIQAMKNVGGKETNTAFNRFRYSGLANELSGAKGTLREVKNSISNNDEFKKIKSHIEPRGFFGKLFRFGNPEKEIKRLHGEGKIDDKVADILRKSITLRKSVEKADSILRWGDAENASLATSTKLNYLAKAICALDSSSLPTGMKQIPPKEEILNMCASGKDRTGLAEHDQSATAIANAIGANVKDIDPQLLASGHTAQQAGGIYSGGATVGCFGTKSENKAGLPKNRKKGLIAIVELSAQSNKVKKAKKNKKTPETKTNLEQYNKQAEYDKSKDKSRKNIFAKHAENIKPTKNAILSKNKRMEKGRGA
ncbi:hypothetical protein OAP56_04495, partial [Rickettsiaceae bacterium]|nr:hypothetical protein [Rickettsiaceae bacterium]